MLQAVIHARDFPVQEHHRELVSALASQGIKIRSVGRLKEIEDDISESFLKEPTLYFRSSSMRVPETLAIAEWHHQNTNIPMIMTSNGEVVSVNLSQALGLERDTFRFKRGIMPFFLSNIDATFERAPVAPPALILYTHNRDKYLPLMLESLVHSIGPTFNEYRLLVVISGPEPYYEQAVRDIVAPLYDKCSCQVVVTGTNAYNSSINLALQWLGMPESFLILEDDFLLPSASQFLYPDWPRLFAYHLRTFDLVGWSVSLTNRPKNWFSYDQVSGQSQATRFWQTAPNFVETDNLWIPSWEKRPILGAQALCMTSEFYRTVARTRPDFSPCDVNLQACANGYLTPSMVGYHLGWNQEQNGYGPLTKEGRWKSCPETNKLTDVVTGESRSFRLEDILG
jgi:hypothetical protein